MYSKIRSQRMAVARGKGKHSKSEWIDMKVYFANYCAKCLTYNKNIELDHIIPIYLGGSDSIRNIQPLCDKCNCSKGNENIDHRPSLAEFIGIDLPESYTKPY